MTLDETRFSYAIGKIFGAEGGLTNDPNDPGGETNFGISLKFLQDNKIDGSNQPCAHPTAADIANLTKDQAKSLYKTFFWDAYKINQIHSLTLASAVLSIAVLMGGRTAILLMQKALNSMHPLSLITDGLIGNNTLYAINTTDPVELNSAFKNQCIQYVKSLCAKNPAFNEFKDGWLNRIDSL